MYPHAKGGSDRGMWITYSYPQDKLFIPTPPIVINSGMWITWNLYVNKVIWLCQSVMLDGKDDGVAVKDPTHNILPSLSSFGMAGDLCIPTISSSMALVIGEASSTLSPESMNRDRYKDL